MRGRKERRKERANEARRDGGRGDRRERTRALIIGEGRNYGKKLGCREEKSCKKEI